MKRMIFAFIIPLLFTSAFSELRKIPGETFTYGGDSSIYKFVLQNNALKHEVLVGTIPIKYFDLNIGLYSFYKCLGDSLYRHTWLPFGLGLSPYKTKNIYTTLASDFYLFGKSDTIFNESYVKMSYRLLPIFEDVSIHFSLVGGYRYFFNNEYSSKSDVFFGASISYGAFFKRDITAQTQQKVESNNLKYSLRVSTLKVWDEFLSLYPNYESTLTGESLDKAISKSNEQELLEFSLAHKNTKHVNEIIYSVLDEYSFSTLKQDHTLEGCRMYLSEFSRGIHLNEVHEIIRSIEDNMWLKASKSNDVKGYREYLKEFPSGQFKFDAQHWVDNREEELWRRITKAANIKDYEADVFEYSRDFPSGKYIKLIKEIALDPQWSYAQKRNTKEDLLAYMQNKPESQNVCEALGFYLKAKNPQYISLTINIAGMKQFEGAYDVLAETWVKEDTPISTNIELSLDASYSLNGSGMYEPKSADVSSQLTVKGNDSEVVVIKFNDSLEGNSFFRGKTTEILPGIVKVELTGPTDFVRIENGRAVPETSHPSQTQISEYLLDKISSLFP